MDSDYTVDDDFESHESPEEMLRYGIFDVLNIKENTSPVNAENIYHYTFDQWFSPDLGARFEQYYEHHRHSNGNAHVCTQCGDCER
jgi:hypothetical protein